LNVNDYNAAVNYQKEFHIEYKIWYICWNIL